MRRRTDAPILQGQQGLLCIMQDGNGPCEPYYLMGTWDFGGSVYVSDGIQIEERPSLTGEWINEFGDRVFVPAWWISLDEILAEVRP